MVINYFIIWFYIRWLAVFAFQKEIYDLIYLQSWLGIKLRVNDTIA